MLDFNTLNWIGPAGLRPRLATLPDPRHRRGIRHRLDHVLPGRWVVPSIETLRRTLIAVDPEALSQSRREERGPERCGPVRGQRPDPHLFGLAVADIVLMPPREAARRP